MKAVVLIAFYVWLALTVAIVLGRLARWSASRQAARRRRKARAAARQQEAASPITSTGPERGATIDLGAEIPAHRLAPIEQSTPAGVASTPGISPSGPPAHEPPADRPSQETPMRPPSRSNEVDEAAQSARIAAAAAARAAEERRVEERRATERRVGDRRGGDRRHRDAAGDQGPVPVEAGAPSHEQPAPVTPAPAIPTPATATPEPAPALARLLAGIAIPADLTPIVAEGSTPSQQSTALISRTRPAHEVGTGIADELERLGFSLTPVGDAALLATRGTDVLTVEIDQTPDRPDQHGQVRFPTADPNDVVVEFWVGSGPRPS